MTKKELIKYIETNSGETESWGKLSTMRKEELQKIFNYLQKASSIQMTEEVKEVEVEVENEIEEVKVVIDPVKGQEYVEHKKPSELSISERRAYARTGVLPKIKVNKYDRFDSEEVKFGF